MHDLYGIVPDRPPTAPAPRPTPALARRLVPDARRRRTAAADSPTTTEPYPFLTVEGTGVYEIPVGPVHAGLIEPGHFRFSVVGETILKLKARLWFVHRGVEKLFEGRPARRRVRPRRTNLRRHRRRPRPRLQPRRRRRTAASTCPRARNACAACCSNSNASTTTSPTSARSCNDVGHGVAQRPRTSPPRTAAAHQRRRHRPPAAARRDPHRRRLTLPRCPTATQLHRIAADVAELADLALANTIVADRFTGTAVLTAAQARDLGSLGYVARASGIATDARLDHPITTPTRSNPSCTPAATSSPASTCAADEFAASATPAHRPRANADRRSTAHRGTRRHIAMAQAPASGSSKAGAAHRPPRRTRRRRHDSPESKSSTHPSSTGPPLPVALADTIVPDFPLANKSFNLSYAGNDL